MSDDDKHEDDQTDSAYERNRKLVESVRVENSEDFLRVERARVPEHINLMLREKMERLGFQWQSGDYEHFIDERGEYVAYPVGYIRGPHYADNGNPRPLSYSVQGVDGWHQQSFTGSASTAVLWALQKAKLLLHQNAVEDAYAIEPSNEGNMTQASDQPTQPKKNTYVIAEYYGGDLKMLVLQGETPWLAYKEYRLKGRAPERHARILREIVDQEDGYGEPFYFDACIIEDGQPKEVPMQQPWETIRSMNKEIREVKQKLEDAEKLISLQDIPGMDVNPRIDLTPARDYLEKLTQERDALQKSWDEETTDPAEEEESNQ